MSIFVILYYRKVLKYLKSNRFDLLQEYPFHFLPVKKLTTNHEGKNTLIQSEGGLFDTRACLYEKKFQRKGYNIKQTLIISENIPSWKKMLAHFFMFFTPYVWYWIFVFFAIPLSFLLVFLQYKYGDGYNFDTLQGVKLYLLLFNSISLPVFIAGILPFSIFGFALIPFFAYKIYSNFLKQSMESLGFEKSFDVFSRDPVEARMIITPAFMDRLEEFSNKWQLQGKIRIIWEKDTFTLLLKGDIEKYGKESDGSYTLVKSMEEILNLGYYSLPPTNTNNA